MASARRNADVSRRSVGLRVPTWRMFCQWSPSRRSAHITCKGERLWVPIGLRALALLAAAMAIVRSPSRKVDRGLERLGDLANQLAEQRSNLRIGDDGAGVVESAGCFCRAGRDPTKGHRNAGEHEPAPGPR